MRVDVCCVCLCSVCSFVCIFNVYVFVVCVWLYVYCVCSFVCMVMSVSVSSPVGSVSISKRMSAHFIIVNIASTLTGLALKPEVITQNLSNSTYQQE